jgi:Ca-activated chloride channel family protein
MADKFRKYIESPVLTNINTRFEGFAAYDIEPLAMADVFAERPLIIFGKWKGKATGEIQISGTSGKGAYSKTLKVTESAIDPRNSALTYLWARERIRVLDDYASLDTYTASIQEEVTNLGLKYNLLTQYTSFIAIDNLVRNTDGTFTTVNQPLPLPQGVSNYAIGGVSGYGMSRSQQPLHKTGKGGHKTLATEEVDYAAPLVEIEDKDDLNDRLVETMAEFTGDQNGIEAFIARNLSYPTQALLNKLEGLVYVEFIIGEDGSVSEVKILSSTDAVFNQEALRLIQLTNKHWKPAESGGVKVKSKMILPVSFKIE